MEHVAEMTPSEGLEGRRGPEGVCRKTDEVFD
jgi:hypothetical protein